MGRAGLTHAVRRDNKLLYFPTDVRLSAVAESAPVESRFVERSACTAEGIVYTLDSA